MPNSDTQISERITEKKRTLALFLEKDIKTWVEKIGRWHCVVVMVPCVLQDAILSKVFPQPKGHRSNS